MINALASEQCALGAGGLAAIRFLGLVGCGPTSSGGGDQVMAGHGGSRR
jgi:hypothetical protein